MPGSGDQVSHQIMTTSLSEYYTAASTARVDCERPSFKGAASCYKYMKLRRVAEGLVDEEHNTTSKWHLYDSTKVSHSHKKCPEKDVGQ